MVSGLQENHAPEYVCVWGGGGGSAYPYGCFCGWLGRCVRAYVNDIISFTLLPCPADRQNIRKTVSRVKDRWVSGGMDVSYSYSCFPFCLHPLLSRTVFVFVFILHQYKQPGLTDIREVSLYVITYENPYVVRAGERGQLSYVNLSTDFRS